MLWRGLVNRRCVRSIVQFSDPLYRPLAIITGALQPALMLLFGEHVGLYIARFLLLPLPVSF